MENELLNNIKHGYCVYPLYQVTLFDSENNEYIFSGSRTGFSVKSDLSMDNIDWMNKWIYTKEQFFTAVMEYIKQYSLDLHYKEIEEQLELIDNKNN